MASESGGVNWHAECLYDGGGAKGMPQLCVDWMPNQVFWLLIALVVLFFILSKIALPRIGAVLAERKGTITNDLAAAEELKLKAQAAERAYEEALATARAEAAKIVAATKAEIQKELDAATARADADISARTAQSEAKIAEIRAGAAEAVEAVAKDTAKELVAHFGGSVEPGSIGAAVAERLKG